MFSEEGAMGECRDMQHLHRDDGGPVFGTLGSFDSASVNNIRGPKEGLTCSVLAITHAE